MGRFAFHCSWVKRFAVLFVDPDPLFDGLAEFFVDLGFIIIVNTTSISPGQLPA
jgi:hypothetical protein